jgi:hypothetical protein
MGKKSKRRATKRVASQCSLEYCENPKYGACGECAKDLCATCMLGCMRVFKHPDFEDETPGAAFGFRCPLCRTPCGLAERFEDLAWGGECDVKELMGVTNTRELSVRKNCGSDCTCVNADIHLTHRPCEEGCYTCFASTIAYRLEDDSDTEDDMDVVWEYDAAITIQSLARRYLGRVQMTAPPPAPTPVFS